ncbi:PRC and DUF2382 domain-containing protein [Cryptosporangium minutisporangium]|uniref:PRC and DUF2382 domain-containing protein n=1 Tax=Cryptosporangium minutisporangium TaxID=113569 RepID=A0ABP6ST59_9ACTN
MSAQWKAGELLDREVFDRHGDRIGTVERVYVDAQSQAPTFIAIRTGLLSRSSSIVPLTGAVPDQGAVVLPLEKDRVKGAPTVEPAGRNGGLSPAQERALHTFFGLTPDDDAPQARTPATPPPSPATAPQPPAPSPPAQQTVSTERAADDAMTRSEEQLRIHTESQPAARARLKKYVVTEEVQVTVPVSREEFRVEWEPIDPDADPATTTPADAVEASDTDDTDEGVTLHAERIVVRTETVPTERVHLAKEQVTDEQTVSGQVRREKIDLEQPPPD